MHPCEPAAPVRAALSRCEAASFLDEEGWEFRQGLARMACLCSLMSGLHLGWLEAWGCRHLEMTHPVGAWAGMPWRLGSAGSVNRGPYVWPLHVARAQQIRAAQFQEGHQRVNVSGELNKLCCLFDPELEITRSYIRLVHWSRQSSAYPDSRGGGP